MAPRSPWLDERLPFHCHDQSATIHLCTILFSHGSCEW